MRLLVLLPFFVGFWCELVSAHQIKLQLVEYHNPFNRLYNGQHCERMLSRTLDKNDVCDPTFGIYFCLGNRCKLNAHIHGYANKPHLRFGQIINRVRNPLVVPISKIEKEWHIMIKIYDHDTLIVVQRELIEEFHLTLSSESIHKMNLSSSLPIYHMKPRYLPGDQIMLSVRFWYSCDDGFYGVYCNKSCRPSANDDDGYYGCALHTGDQVCVKGRFGPNCRYGNVCVLRNPCFGRSSKCTPKLIQKNSMWHAENFQCDCPPYLTGQRCETPVKLCSQRQKSEHMGGHSCQNGGQCVVKTDLNTNKKEVVPQSKSAMCVCPNEWYGQFCQLKTVHRTTYHPLEFYYCRSINTLKTLTSPSGYHVCLCKPNWGGEFCENRTQFHEQYSELEVGQMLTEWWKVATVNTDDLTVNKVNISFGDAYHLPIREASPTCETEVSWFQLIKYSALVTTLISIIFLVSALIWCYVLRSRRRAKKDAYDLIPTPRFQELLVHDKLMNPTFSHPSSRTNPIACVKNALKRRNGETSIASIPNESDFDTNTLYSEITYDLST